MPETASLPAISETRSRRGFRRGQPRPRRHGLAGTGGPRRRGTWHLHGMPMHVVARDGFELGSASFRCDTLGVNPGERWDVVIDCDAPGAWAFHCHILPHAEGSNGMFGMVTALVVQDATSAGIERSTGVGDVAAAAVAGGSTAYLCRIP